MVTPVEKRSSNKFYDFHNDKGHSTDECMQLKNQIEELVRACKLSHLIKEIKQGKDQPKVGEKEVPAKDKSMAIYMIQSWHRMTRQKVTKCFKHVSEIKFPSLTTSNGIEGLLVIEAEISRHIIHRMYVDRGSLMEVLYEQSFYRGMDGLHDHKVIINLQWYHWKTWNKRNLTVPSTAHGMLKFPVDGGIVTIRNTILIPTECATVITSPKEVLKEAEVHHENLKLALHPNFPDQEVAIGGTLSVNGRTELCSLLKKNLCSY
ncbi:hypothetical protein Tco_0832121 [Tanacetum coccineum]